MTHSQFGLTLAILSRDGSEVPSECECQTTSRGCVELCIRRLFGSWQERWLIRNDSHGPRSRQWQHSTVHLPCFMQSFLELLTCSVISQLVFICSIFPPFIYSLAVVVLVSYYFFGYSSFKIWIWLCGDPGKLSYFSSLHNPIFSMYLRWKQIN
jgi:hypothetical protein